MLKPFASVVLCIVITGCASTDTADVSSSEPSVAAATLPESSGAAGSAPAADEEASTAAVASNSSEIVCRKEKTTGSNLRQTICRRVADVEREAEHDQRTLTRQMRPMATNAP